MNPSHAPLAITLGDPAGIGPEVILGAWARLRAERRAPPAFVVGGAGLLRAAGEALRIDCPVVPIATADEAAFACAAGLPVMAGLDVPYAPGQPTADGAQAALASLQWGTRLARAGTAAGVVTAPIAKAALAAIGWDYPGQTEYLADACGAPYRDAVMMLAGPSLRTVPLTVHVALAEVPALLSPGLIVHKARIVAAGLTRDFGIPRPRLAIAALNRMRESKASSAMRKRGSLPLRLQSFAPRASMPPDPCPATRCSRRARAKAMTRPCACITIRR